MEDLFVPYELALELKELGFDEKCVAYYKSNILKEKGWDYTESQSKVNYIFGVNNDTILAPLYQQAFKFFREKYDFDLNWKPMTMVGITCYYDIEIHNPKYVWSKPFKVIGKTYEEAELKCLKKLIEIVKK